MNSRFNPIRLLAESGKHRIVRNVFLRALGFVYFCAFASLTVQILGLVGSRGILPVSEFLEAVSGQLPGLAKVLSLPTFCWLNSSDGVLLAQCWLGIAFSIVLMLGVFPLLALGGLWVLWLSLTVACQDFLSFQWENLLLESGLLAIFLAPGLTRLDRAGPPSRIVIWLCWWLVFRLMFLSGMVKLLSGDPAWRNFTALFYHYETQPLPTVLGWYAYHLPTWLDVVNTGVMYLIELVVPFFIFVGRRLRLLAAFFFVVLQLGIATTGNYCYFNLLTIVLCIPLLDDGMLLRIKSMRSEFTGADHSSSPAVLKFRNVAVLTFATFVLLVSVPETLTALELVSSWPAPLQALIGTARPCRSINNYGLFAVMTKSRPEIIIEGSNDAAHWQAYEFRYKPGDLKSRPKFVAPHQPRLDWQMWFAALGTYEQNPWFVNFCVRLLQGELRVLNLMETNPFADHPPKYIRASLYNYEFTSVSKLKQSGEWWKREYLGLYFGPISLKSEPR